MATSLGNLSYATASAAAFAKGRGVTIFAIATPAAVDNSAVKLGISASFDGGTTYYPVNTDVSGTATAYQPVFVVSTLVVLDPTVSYVLQEASHVKITFFATDGTTAASQTAVTLGLALGRAV